MPPVPNKLLHSAVQCSFMSLLNYFKHFMIHNPVALIVSQYCYLLNRQSFNLAYLAKDGTHIAS